MGSNAILDWLPQHMQSWPDLPLQQALYRALRAAIVDGRLRSGQRMPSTRALGSALGVARNTVLAAFARLNDEGYTHARHGAGSFVADGLPERALRTPLSHVKRPSAAPRLSRRSLSWLCINDTPRQRSAGAFVPGMPDLRGFPFRDWWRLLHKHQRHAPWQGFDYGRSGGLPALKSAIAAHLRLARSVVCEPEQVLITAGTQQSLDLCCRVLADPGDRFVLEDPGYLGARAAALSHGLKVLPVPVDRDGIRADRLPRTSPRLIYATPSHQFPLGAVMSLARRRALLDYAAQHDCYVLEDDYDAEFRFVGSPLAALQGLDRRDRVLYLGTFSKVLYPALQLAYLVLPSSLVDAFQRTQERLYGIGHTATQAAMAEFIDSGRFASHLRRMRLHYGARNALLQRLLHDRLPPAWELLGTEAGQHCALMAPAGIDDCALARSAERTLTLRPISPHYLRSPARAGFLLGYAAADERELELGTKQLLTLIGGRAP